MELIHADAGREEIGYVSELSSFDAEISLLPDAKEAGNSWKLTLGEDVWSRSPIREGGYLYIPETEWGGPVEKITHDTAAGLVTLAGVCWRGMLARKVLTPSLGQSHLTFTNVSAERLLRETAAAQLPGLFAVDAGGGTLSATFRYTMMLSGLLTALEGIGYTLDCRYDGRMVRARARAIVDYASLLDLSQDYGIDFVSESGSLTGYNHIIALGRGELTERAVVELYRLEDGTVTATRPDWAGSAKDRVTVYDYSSAETTQELIRGATARLQEYGLTTSLALDASSLDIPAQLGDIVGARDRVTGMAGKAPITGMILKMDASGTTIEKRVG